MSCILRKLYTQSIRIAPCKLPIFEAYKFCIMPKKKITFKQAFKTIIWPRRKLVFTGLILIAVSKLSGLVLPVASKYLIDDVIVKKDFELLKLLLIAVTVAIAVQAVTSFALTRIVSVQAQYLISELRTQVQQKVLSLPIRFFDNTKSGALVSRVMSDVEGVRNLIGTGLVQMVGGVLTAIVSLVLLLRISVSMTLFVLIPVGIFGYIALRAFSYIRPIFRKRGAINAEVKGRLTETLAGIRVIKGFGAEDQENKIFEEGVDRLFQNVKKSLTATALMTSSSTFLLGVASVGIMGIGGYKIIQDELTIGDFLSFTLLLGFMVAPIVQMGNVGSQLTEALAGLDRTEELMAMTPETELEDRHISIPDLQGNIKFDRVSFYYEENKNVLHNISFDAPPGSVTALVGSSGSGKSTIAGLAASFLTTHQGTIWVDGHPMNNISLLDYRTHLGVVLQDDFLFEGTIRQNIIFARPDASEDEIQDAVQAAYVNEFTDTLDEGLQTLIGERGIKLSGGQRQRISIARAILADPKILILDEATSNLDTESEAMIQKSLERLMRGRTTFVIAHRLSTIRKADQILVIEKGHIAEQGTHEELIAKEGRYYDLYTFQARI